jgi:hypothetical protein
LAARSVGHDLLELVEDEDRVARPSVEVAAAVQVPGDGQLREVPDRALLVGRQTVLEGEQGVEDVGVRHRCARHRRVGWELVGQADDRQHLEAVVLEPGYEAGPDERRLAGARRRVQQHHTLGDEQVDEVLGLAIASVEPVAAVEGPRPDEGVGVEGCCTGRGGHERALHASPSSLMKLSVLPQ